MDGSSILSEFESYYTAQSETSRKQSDIVDLVPDDDHSSATSIIDLDNMDQIFIQDE